MTAEERRMEDWEVWWVGHCNPAVSERLAKVEIETVPLSEREQRVLWLMYLWSERWGLIPSVRVLAQYPDLGSYGTINNARLRLAETGYAMRVGNVFALTTVGWELAQKIHRYKFPF